MPAREKNTMQRTCKIAVRGEWRAPNMHAWWFTTSVRRASSGCGVEGIRTASESDRITTRFKPLVPWRFTGQRLHYNRRPRLVILNRHYRFVDNKCFPMLLWNMNFRENPVEVSRISAGEIESFIRTCDIWAAFLRPVDTEISKYRVALQALENPSFVYQHGGEVEGLITNLPSTWVYVTTSIPRTKIRVHRALEQSLLSRNKL